MTPALLQLHSRRRFAFVTGVAGLALCLIGGLHTPSLMFQGWWFAWLFWSGLSFGSFALLVLHHLARGEWGRAIQRPAEASVMTLPLMMLLLLPAFFGLHEIFPWTRAEIFAGHEWRHKEAYLRPVWFIIRTLSYFALLLPLAWRLRSASARGEATRGLGGAGAVAYFLCMLFASTDWVLSLEPTWYSTMFVVIFAVTQFLGALALATFQVASRGALWLGGAPSQKQLHDLGNLLLAFVIFWAYVSFSQFMLIWMGNLPREISWYLHRRSGGWLGLVVALAVCQFALPFALLLLRVLKQHATTLAPLAGLILCATAANIYWLVAPSWHPEGLHLPWCEMAAFIGIGGIWCATYLSFLGHSQPMPAMEVSHV